MRVSRTRLIAAAVVLLAAAGAVLAAGSFASGHAPAAVHRTAALAQRTFVSAASGDDTNPCTRSAPCRNFQAAIAQTSSGGEVVVLDSGGYGSANVTQAVSLVAPPGVYAGISVFCCGFGITINAGASDVVTIRGLTFNGLGGNGGIVIHSAAAVYVQDSVFKNFASAGIGMVAAAGGHVAVEDSLFTRCDRGVDLRGSAAIQATIDHSRIEDGVEGVDAGPNANIVVRDSVSSGNSDAGFYTESGGQIDLENSLTTHNHYGLLSNGSMRVSQTTIEENTVGLVMFAGTTTSFGNNRLAGNGTNGSFTSTIGLQ